MAIPLTELMVQKVSFTDTEEHRTLISCIDNIQISWQYRSAFGEWKEGDGDIFRVDSYTKNGDVRDQKVIQTMEVQ